MKWNAKVFLLLSLVFILSVTVFAEGGSRFYRDDSTGAGFEIPEGWTLNVGAEGGIEATMCPETDPATLLLYSSVDTYEETRSRYEQAGETMPYSSRAEYDQYACTKNGASSAFNCDVSKVRSATYGGITYYYTEMTLSLAENTISYPAVYFMRVENGIMYFFQFYGEKDSRYFKDVEALLGSAEYPHADAQDIINAQKKDLWDRLAPLNLLISLLVTITIYSLPIFIYRWCIRKYPVDEKPAKIITVVYGIVAFIVMSVLVFALNGEGAAGGAILLWSFVNYKVLTGGKDKRRKLSKKVWTEDELVSPVTPECGETAAPVSEETE